MCSKFCLSPKMSSNSCWNEYKCTKQSNNIDFSYQDMMYFKFPNAFWANFSLQSCINVYFFGCLKLFTKRHNREKKYILDFQKCWDLLMLYNKLEIKWRAHYLLVWINRVRLRMFAYLHHTHLPKNCQLGKSIFKTNKFEN